jgi:hypothetical protein
MTGASPRNGTTTVIKTKIFALVLSTGAVLGVATPGTAMATDPQNVSIPASACQVADPDELDEVQLVSGSWVFHGATGVVTLFCPIGRKEDGNNWTFGRMRVYYRDTDGQGTHARVDAFMHERLNTAVTSAEIADFTSNDHGDQVNTTKGVDIGVPMEDDTLYFVEVHLYRLDTSEDPAFHGIDFKPL